MITMDLVSDSRACVLLFEAKRPLVPDSQDPKAVFSDTNDYESFPSFELSKGPIFEDLSRFFPGPSVSQPRMYFSPILI
jgi:hypothetical protein